MKPEIKNHLNWIEGDYILTAFWTGGPIRVMIRNMKTGIVREESIPLHGLPEKILEILTFSYAAHDKLKYNLEKD